MEIILLEHIDSLGTVGETVKVKAGYARNYLFPQKLACPANKKNLNFYRTLIEAKQRKLARDKEAAETQAKQLAALTLTFTRKSRDEEARLFGSVTTADITAALGEKGFELDRKKIVLPEPIKKLGEHKAGVRLHPEVTAELNVVVEPEEQPEDAA
jgi:large subunit ribosomal protein L9